MKRFQSCITHLLFTASLLVSAGGHAAAVIGQSYTEIIKNDEKDDPKMGFRSPETVAFPADNLYTPAKARLGRALFFDPRLSRAGSLSCSSCHLPALSYGDGSARSVGAGATFSLHRSPTIINAAWSDVLMWDGHFTTLEQQSIGVLEARGVMDTPVVSAVTRLSGIDGYRTMFETAFPGQPINGTTIGRALATYERTIVAGRSPFDAWVDGNAVAISGAAEAGFGLFIGKAKCVVCHSGPNFSDNGFHDIGLPGNAVASSVLSDIRKLGVRVAIDDFGVGYSSLSYLRRLPVDVVKLDRSFLEDVGTDPNGESFISAVVALAHSVGKVVVLEGIETQDQSDIARAVRADMVQGFLFAPPLSENAARELLAQHQQIDDLRATLLHGS